LTQRAKSFALTILARYNYTMGAEDDFDSKFEEIISQENFEEADFQKIAVSEISDTLASISFLCAQLSNLLNESLKTAEIEISASFMEILKEVKDASEKFNEEILIEIEFGDTDEDNEDEEEEESDDRDEPC
jgi:hypothetical protein